MNRYDAGFSSGKHVFAVLGIVVVVIVAVLILNRDGYDDPAQTASAPDGTEAHLTEREGRRAEPRERATVPETAAEAAEEPAQPEPERELRLHGRVTAASGEYPIGNAEVLLFLDQEGPLTNPAHQAVTDEEGNYELLLRESEFPRRSTVLAARAEGYAAERHEVQRGRPRPGGSIRQDFTLRPGGTVSGVVRNQRGNPVGNATVSLAKFPQTEELYTLVARGENPHRFFPSAETSAEGYFRLEGLPRDPSLRLYVEARDYLKHLTGPVSIGDRDLVIILEDGEASLHGRVLDSDGTPVADLPVRALHGGSTSGAAGLLRGFADREAQLTSLYHTRTDERGRYEFPALRSGAQSVLAGFGAPSSRSVAENIMLSFGDNAELNLRFPPTRVIQGVVVDRASGEPVPQVTLTANPVGTPLAAFYAEAGGGSGAEEVMTNQHGEFELKIEPRVERQLGGETRIYYRVPVHYDPMAEDSWQAEALSARLIERLDSSGEKHTIEIGRSHLIRGRVVAVGGEDGQEEIPVAGATVRWGGEERPDPVTQLLDEALLGSGRTGKEAQTRSDGTFELWAAVDPNAESGTRRGRGRMPNRINVLEAKHGEISGEETVEFENGEPREVKITLQQVGSLRGRAIGPDEEPVPGSEIQLIQIQRAMQGATPELKSAFTDDDGRFAFENVPTGRLMLMAHAVPGFVPPEQRNVTINANEETEITLDYQRAIPFEGYVVDNNEDPIRGAEVTLTQPVGGWMARIMGTGTVYTDAEGRFKIENLPETADSLAFRVGHTNYETREVRNILPEDSPVTITLQGRASLEFTAHSGGAQRTSFEYEIQQQGRPQRGAGMMMRGGPGGAGGIGGARTVHLQTSPVKETVEPGRYTLHIHGISEEDGRRDGTYGAEDFQIERNQEGVLKLEVELLPELVVEGRVVDDEGEPIADAEVQIHQAGRAGAMAARWQRARGGGGGAVDPVTTDSRGLFRFEGLTAGRFEVRAEKDDLVQRETVTISVEAGQETDYLTVELVRGGTIFGSVTGVDGRPHTIGYVYADVSDSGRRAAAPAWGGGRGGEDEHRSELDDSGNYRLTALPPGRHRVVLFDGDFGREIMHLDVQLGVNETAEVDFDMQGLIELEGTLNITGMSIGRGGTMGTGFRLVPTEETEGGTLLPVNNRQNYRVYIRPGTYELNVSPRGIGENLPTGAIVEVRDRPPRQSSDIGVGLHELDIVVVSPRGADFRGGRGRLSFEGLTRTVTFQVNLSERITTLPFMPEGVYGENGRLNAEDGRVYLPLEGEVGPRGDNIVTFVSEEELGI